MEEWGIKKNSLFIFEELLTETMLYDHSLDLDKIAGIILYEMENITKCNRIEHYPKKRLMKKILYRMRHEMNMKHFYMIAQLKIRVGRMVRNFHAIRNSPD